MRKMRKLLMATVAVSMIFGAASSATAQDYRRNDNGRAVVYGIAGLALGLALGARSHDRDDRYYYGRRAYYRDAPGRPRVYCQGDYYQRDCRTYHNGQTPADDVRYDSYEERYSYDAPRASADPPPLPGFYVDPETRTTPCGFDLQRCMKNGR